MAESLPLQQQKSYFSSFTIPFSSTKKLNSSSEPILPQTLQEPFISSSIPSSTPSSTPFSTPSSTPSSSSFLNSFRRKNTNLPLKKKYNNEHENTSYNARRIGHKISKTTGLGNTLEKTVGYYHTNKYVLSKEGQEKFKTDYESDKKYFLAKLKDYKHEWIIKHNSLINENNFNKEDENSIEYMNGISDLKQKTFTIIYSAEQNLDIYPLKNNDTIDFTYYYINNQKYFEDKYYKNLSSGNKILGIFNSLEKITQNPYTFIWFNLKDKKELLFNLFLMCLYETKNNIKQKLTFYDNNIKYPKINTKINTKINNKTIDILNSRIKIIEVDNIDIIDDNTGICGKKYNEIIKNCNFDISNFINFYNSFDTKKEFMLFTPDYKKSWDFGYVSKAAVSYLLIASIPTLLTPVYITTWTIIWGSIELFAAVVGGITTAGAIIALIAVLWLCFKFITLTNHEAALLKDFYNSIYDILELVMNNIKIFNYITNDKYGFSSIKNGSNKSYIHIDNKLLKSLEVLFKKLKDEIIHRLPNNDILKIRNLQEKIKKYFPNKNLNHLDNDIEKEFNKRKLGKYSILSIDYFSKDYGIGRSFYRYWPTNIRAKILSNLTLLNTKMIYMNFSLQTQFFSFSLTNPEEFKKAYLVFSKSKEYNNFVLNKMKVESNINISNKVNLTYNKIENNENIFKDYTIIKKNKLSIFKNELSEARKIKTVNQIIIMSNKNTSLKIDYENEITKIINEINEDIEYVHSRFKNKTIPENIKQINNSINKPLLINKKNSSISSGSISSIKINIIKSIPKIEKNKNNIKNNTNQLNSSITINIKNVINTNIFITKEIEEMKKEFEKIKTKMKGNYLYSSGNDKTKKVKLYYIIKSLERIKINNCILFELYIELLIKKIYDKYNIKNIIGISLLDILYNKNIYVLTNFFSKIKLLETYNNIIQECKNKDINDIIKSNPKFYSEEGDNIDKKKIILFEKDFLKSLFSKQNIIANDPNEINKIKEYSEYKILEKIRKFIESKI